MNHLGKLKARDLTVGLVVVCGGDMRIIIQNIPLVGNKRMLILAHHTWDLTHQPAWLHAEVSGDELFLTFDRNE